MRLPKTPLGFLHGEVDRHTHCIFVYTKQDDSYFKSVTEYLLAGLNAGEFCLCAVNEDQFPEIKDRMVSLGADISDGQLELLNAKDIYTLNGKFDAWKTLDNWIKILTNTEKKWHGIRVFGDNQVLTESRNAKLKLLEYESIANIDFKLNIAMCAYESNDATRSFLKRMKSVHPFTAFPRSFQKNSSYLEPYKFFKGFYRLFRSGKIYFMRPKQIELIRNDLEIHAVRTPLTLTQIDDLKIAVTIVVENLQKIKIGKKGRDSRIQVIFAPKTDKYSVLLRLSSSEFDITKDALYPLADLIRPLADNEKIQILDSHSLITIDKKYKFKKFQEYGLDFSNILPASV